MMEGEMMGLLVEQGGFAVILAVLIVGGIGLRRDFSDLKERFSEKFNTLEDDLDDEAAELKGMIRGKADKSDLNRIERKIGEINGRVREHSRAISSMQGRQQEREE